MTEPLIAERWGSWLRRSALAIAIGAGFVVVLYGAIRIGAIYRLQRDLQETEVAVEKIQKEHVTLMKDLAVRLDDLERVLYGDVLEKVDVQAKRPLRLEVYQQLQNKALSERLAALERWRLRSEQDQEQR